MGNLSVTWDKFTVHKKHDIDRDRPYLWVFGIVIDAKTIESRRFVTRRRSDSRNLETSSIKKYGKGDSSSVPSALDVTLTVEPFAGSVTAAVAVVAWENAMTRDKVIEDAYDAAADALDELISEIVDDRLEDVLALIEKGVFDIEMDELNPVELAGLTLTVEKEVRDTIKAGWTIFQLIPDHRIGTGMTFESLKEDEAKDLDFRFVAGSTDYELNGRLTYTAAAKPKSKPPKEPTVPPSKGLQSPKPQAELGVR